MKTNERDIVVSALKHAAPYIRLYKGKTFVLKAGGAVFAEAGSTRALVEQVAVLHQLGIRIVFVHGGGPQSTELAEALGVTTQMVQGRRVTDEKSLEITTMVLNGLINTRILAACRDLELPAVGISGVDAGLIKAGKRPPVVMEESSQPVDFGYVGDIEDIDVDILEKQLSHGLMPVVSPISADSSGTLLNIKRRYCGRGSRRFAPSREIDPGDGSAGHPRRRRRSRFAALIPRPRWPDQAPGPGLARRRHDAQGALHRNGADRRRCTGCTSSRSTSRTASSSRSSPTREPERWSSRASRA